MIGKKAASRNFVRVAILACLRIAWTASRSASCSQRETRRSCQLWTERFRAQLRQASEGHQPRARSFLAGRTPQKAFAPSARWRLRLRLCWSVSERTVTRPMHHFKAGAATLVRQVFQAVRPLVPDDLVRGQYAGYRKEPDVAPNSDVETFCALRLFIDSWRWEGVPW